MILLSNLDLSRNQLINAVIEVEPTSTAPQTPSLGQVYFDSTLDTLRQYKSTGWASVGIVTNLALGTLTATTIPITNTNGTGFTLPIATTLLAGLMSAADKVKINATSGTNTGDQNLFSSLYDDVGVVTLTADTKTTQLRVEGGTNIGITLNNTSKSMAIGLVNTVGVTNGGTGASSLTDHGVLIGSGTGAITALAVATNGQLLIGSTGADPVLATLTNGTGISITNAAGSITIGHSNSIVGTGYGPSANATLAYSGTFTVPRLVFDSQGHITGGANCTMTMMATPTATTVGLGNVSNVKQIPALASIVTAGSIPAWTGGTADTLSVGYTVETTLVGASTAIPRADAVKTYVDTLISASNAMVFKGTLGTGGTITALPTTYNAGWTYVVITAGTYAGNACEVGDMIIAIVTRAGTGNLNSDWTVVQTNVNGAVVGPASSTSGNFPVFSGTTGKLIANSTYGPSSFALMAGTTSTTFYIGTTATSLKAESGMIKIWDSVGNGYAHLGALQIISNVANGTAPFLTSSTTRADNFNADLLDGNHASAFALVGHTHTLNALGAAKVVTYEINGDGTETLYNFTLSTSFTNENVSVTVRDHYAGSPNFGKIVLVDTSITSGVLSVSFGQVVPMSYMYSVVVVGLPV